MSDRDGSTDALQALLVENTTYQPEAGVAEQFATVCGHNARRFLPAVLKRVETQVGQDDSVFMSVDPKEATVMSNRQGWHGLCCAPR